MIGTGILKGMAVTLRILPEVISRRTPDHGTISGGANPLPENYGNFPILIYDTDDAEAGLRCSRCKILREGVPAAVHLYY